VSGGAGEASTPVTRIVGRGRAGGSFAAALADLGWSVELIGHDDRDLPAAATGVDLLLLCVPDAAIAATAARVAPDPGTVVAHCSGASGLAVLAPHVRRASIHPLVSLPDPVSGARSLRGAWFALAGDPTVGTVARAVDGHTIDVPDSARERYHAAAVIASNHLVALMGQVERVARSVDVPLEAFLDLASGSLDNVRSSGPVAALTGPVARGDHATVLAHLRALDPAERPAYRAMAEAAARLAGVPAPFGAASSDDAPGEP
jgi:predicted short-subunit dehydrogenase-like oxidoreductase (DUF2520 family)